MSDSFNELIDIAVAAGHRFLELPVFLLILLVLLFTALAWLTVRFTRKERRPASENLPLWCLSAILLMSVVLFDAKLASLTKEVRQWRTEMLVRATAAVPPTLGKEPAPSPGRPPVDQSVPARAATPEVTSPTPVTQPAEAASATPPADSGRSTPKILYDAKKLEEGLEALFEEVALRVVPQANPIDYLWIHATAPEEVQIHVAVVNLTAPQIEVVITPELGEKWLTSRFAAENDCIVAVNGEAGRSPGPTSGLGMWKGNWIVRGKAVTLDDSAHRPFLSFDSRNRARYYKASIVDTEVTPEKYNTIWGRFDILVHGELHASQRGRGSRNLMAIDSEGTTLYLMIVDGRRPGHSVGLDLPTCGKILQLLGATDGMMCDQGGSAAMCLKSVKGLVSTPADVRGERPTYSHFGIGLKTPESE